MMTVSCSINAVANKCFGFFLAVILATSALNQASAIAAPTEDQAKRFFANAKNAIFPPKPITYQAAKEEFDAAGKIQALEYESAKDWFRKKGYGDEFETYFEAKEFFEKKGYLKPVKTYYDGSGQFSFAREGEVFNKEAFHDIIVALHLSDFVYRIGELRKATRALSFEKEELEQEVLVGDSFDTNAYSKCDPDFVKNCEQAGRKWNPKEPMLQLVQGTLDINPDPTLALPNVNMAQLEDVMKYKGLKKLNKDCANELVVSAIHSLKVNKVFLYKFDAKYNDKNLVYAIAARERQNGLNINEYDTDLFITFRGSVTARDWWQNIQAPLVDIVFREDKKSGKCFMIEQLSYHRIEIEEDLYEKLNAAIEEDTPIRVHKGFLGYLFADYGGNKGKYDKSMFESIQSDVKLLLSRPGMKTNTLYVTGHSLGGALATLASFFLACDCTINGSNTQWSMRSQWKGVKCISFASPLVGNVSFQRAFDVLQEHQEGKQRRQRLKHIRFTNNRDLVPLLPPFTRYRHTAGTHVHLGGEGPFGRVGKPSIRENRPQYRSFLGNHPTSLLSGCFATTFKFLGCIVTTVPAVTIGVLVLLRPIMRILPSIYQFRDFFVRIVPSLNNVPEFLDKVKNLPQGTALVIFVPFLIFGHAVYVGMVKNTSVPTRLATAISLIAASNLGLYILNADLYRAIANNWEVYFVVAAIVAQIAMLFIRKPGEVFSFHTHSLVDYYNHLRPHHNLLSASSVVMGEEEPMKTNN